MKKLICSAVALMMLATMFVGCGRKNVSDNANGKITENTTQMPTIIPEPSVMTVPPATTVPHTTTPATTEHPMTTEPHNTIETTGPIVATETTTGSPRSHNQAR